MRISKRKIHNRLFRIIVIIQIILCFLLILSEKGYAVPENNKTLNLKPGYVYLLSFDEKILRYKLGDNDSLKLEMLSSIFNDNQDLIINPKKSSSTNLIIWTQSNLYNFNIAIDQNNTETSPAIQDFSKENNQLSKDLNQELDGLSLDKPPYLSGESDPVFDFEIDKPPMNKSI